jgi:hypothetical protein
LYALLSQYLPGGFSGKKVEVHLPPGGAPIGVVYGDALHFGVGRIAQPLGKGGLRLYRGDSGDKKYRYADYGFHVVFFLKVIACVAIF